MKRLFGYLMAIGLLMAGSVIHAQNLAEKTAELHVALAELDTRTTQLDLIGYQSVEQPQPDATGAMKYIILDFRAGKSLVAEEDLVASVDTICRSIITNQPLIRNLSNMGYDMVSVAFDDVSQFDCL